MFSDLNVNIRIPTDENNTDNQLFNQHTFQSTEEVNYL